VTMSSGKKDNLGTKVPKLSEIAQYLLSYSSLKEQPDVLSL
jgi:hypothetical protein